MRALYRYWKPAVCILVITGASLLIAHSSAADTRQGPYPAKDRIGARQRLTFKSVIALAESSAPARVEFFCNDEQTTNTVGTLGFDIIVENYAKLSSFHFLDFEGPDAIAYKQTPMKVTVHRPSTTTTSFEISPRGYVLHDPHTGNQNFVFTTAQPSNKASIAKEILKALSTDAQSLEIAISDLRDSSIQLKLSMSLSFASIAKSPMLACLHLLGRKT